MTQTIRIVRDVTMAARDGAELAADIYLPSGEGPYPTLLYRVRGSKSSSFITGAIMLNPIVAAERGFAVCVQEVRGRGRSEGDWHPFVNEANDGWDTMEWLVDQEWCNGRVGAYGTAYTGIDALELAATGHPALDAVVVVVSGVSPHDGWIYTGGAFELGWNTFWSYLTAGESLKRLDAPPAEKAAIGDALQADMEDPMEQMGRLPISDRPALESVSPQYWTWLDHPAYDRYWERLDVVARASSITAKVLSVTGWWDNFQRSHVNLYNALRDQSPAGEHQRMLIGPWDHFTYVNIVPTVAGARNFGPSGVAGPVVSEPMALDWFDRWLKDDPETSATQPGVRWHTGAGEWQESDTWPPPGEDRRLYLRGGGRLSVEPEPDDPPTRYRYDPADPTPTVGGRILMPTVVAPGIQDQSEVVARSDVEVFESDVLSEPLEIAGNVRLELFASSSAVDTDFAAVLVDCDPSGRRWLVADGMVRARHRNGFDREDWLEPGDVVRYEIDLWAVAWLFRPGHHIGVHISSASFPRFDRNLNVALRPGDGTLAEAVVAHQALHHDVGHPSALVLPVRVP